MDLMLDRMIYFHLLLLPLAKCLEKVKFQSGEEADWSNWGQWTTCSKLKYCNSGTAYRQRTCLRSNRFCVGIYMESQDCPKENCEDPTQKIFSDVAEASSSSFISQECDVDIKFSFSGTHAKLVPNTVKNYMGKYVRKFDHGYFNVKKLKGNPNKDLRNMTKYCFEPYHMTLKEAKEIFRFNRTTKSSLNYELEDTGNPMIAGISIIMSDNGHALEGIYFALKSSTVGYRNVFYRRWRGQGFTEAL
ncbi:uncharacterized protein LOC130629188 [Hydractinia symbiolongicarpus]|uniref:uncharacterized protein LOC130629188 n=1 Tax=Hydractinia symbiolongicarpus TaxID=13093 RepID=UPI0025504C59|nr:uncharacterized protein LOC130629188 [Hydractinia symbiolongicarpus]